MSTLEAAVLASPETSPVALPKRTIRTVQQEQVEAAKALIERKDPGVSWPYESLHGITDTLVKGTLIIVGAYTGSGKTTLLLNAMDAWADAGQQVLMFGTEQDAKDLRLKISCMRLGVNSRDARRGRIGTDAEARLKAELDGMVTGGSANVHLYNNPSPTPDQLEQAIRIYAARGVGLFLVDYLGRMDLSEGRGEEWLKMKMLVKRLKNLAVELDIVIVAAAQIGKAETPELSRHQRPELSSFMGGQAIPQEADVALGIYQPLQVGVKAGDLRLVRSGEKAVDAVVETSTMAVSLLKHREGMPLGNTAFFWVFNNRIRPRQPGEHGVPPEMMRPSYI